MKHTYLALFLLFTMAIASCRKSGNDIDIKTYDNNQIRDYIAANGLSVMKRDTVGGDTSGVYYQILNQGKGAALNYDTRITYVLSVKSLDGKFVAADTIASSIIISGSAYRTVAGHGNDAVGLMIPKGLMMAIHNAMKYKGTTARILVPSRLAYGVSGLTVGTSRLPGNESLDYTINVLDDDNTTAMAAYDDLSIRKYCTANNIDINSYKKTQSGLYIKINQVGTGTAAITATSTGTVQYHGILLNGFVFDGNVTDTGYAIDMQTIPLQAWKEGLLGLTSGAKIDLLIPSRLGYGMSSQSRTSPTTGQVEVSIPTTSCLRFGINVLTVTN
jgi:FKBP-type peptidyl-prolyl cis-trans isomerase